MIDWFSEMPDADSGKEHPRGPEADASILQAAQRHAKHADE